MPEKISQPMIDLYDAFTHGAIDRRSFLERLGRLAGGSAAASALLPLLANDYARAAVIDEKDARLRIATAKFATGDVIDMIEPERLTADSAPNAGVIPTRHLPFVTAYHARLRKNEGAAPAIMVIHENRGLNAHIKDIARRIAVEGFDAYAVDMLSPFGGTPDNEDEARNLIGKLKPEKTVQKLRLVADELARMKGRPRKVGAIGFCWGGGMVNRLAAATDALAAGVAYYGPQPTAEEAAQIRAKMLLHYAGEDQRINAGIDEYKRALDAAGVDYQLFIYDGVQHAFNNDANPARYDTVAARVAWDRTIAFLKESLADA